MAPPLITVSAAVLLASLAAASSPAWSIEIARQGNAVILSGPIKLGDEYVFRDRLVAEGATGVRTIWLSSGGGSLDATFEIARRLRREGWTTAVDAQRMRCASACTILFSAGVQRHYLNADRIMSGVVLPAQSRGLGYHQGNSSTSRQPAGFSGAATGYVIGAYHEFGTPAAARLPDLAPPDRLYVLSGTEALAKGIATSLSPP